MEKTLIISKTTQTGSAVEVYALPDFGRYEVVVGGVSGGAVNSVYKQKVGKGAAAKVLWVMNWNGKMVGLTDAEAEVIRAHEKATLPAPVITRASLVCKYQGLCDDQQAAYARAYDRGDENAQSVKASFDAAIAEAFAAVQQWDATH